MAAAGPRLVDPSRPWYHLLLEGVSTFKAFPKPRLPDGTVAGNPLTLWPDEYTPELDNKAWADALEWNQPKLRHTSVLADTGFTPHVINYAFNHVFDDVPSTCCKWSKRLGFESNTEAQVALKQRNFYAALTYIQHYPTQPQMQKIMGLSPSTFYTWIQPTLYKLAKSVDFIDWNLRCETH